MLAESKSMNIVHYKYLKKLLDLQHCNYGVLGETF